MIDAHVHLEFGPLDVSYVLEFLDVAKKKGITKIHILDHTHRFLEFVSIYDELKVIPIQLEWLEKKVLDPIQNFIDLMQHIKTLDLGIEVLYGLEVCYTPASENKIREILQNYQFDFLIGAIHSIDGILYDMNFSKELLWDVYSVDHIYQRYYELVNDCVKSNLFTQLAHPDQIKLYNLFPSFDLHDTYVLLAKNLVKHNVICESNTGAHYRYHLEEIGTNKQLLTILKSHNVQMITASDAHYPEHVGNFIAQIHDDVML